MEFEFLPPPPLVESKKKYATFTVREIGGPEEIIKWREQQAAKESIYRMRLGARDARLSALESLTGQKLEAPKLKQASWEEKKAFAESERARLSKAERDVLDLPPWESPEPPKLSFMGRIVKMFKQLWNNANF